MVSRTRKEAKTQEKLVRNFPGDETIREAGRHPVISMPYMRGASPFPTRSRPGKKNKKCSNFSRPEGFFFHALASWCGRL
jgi:hypothetical protein